VLPAPPSRPALVGEEFHTWLWCGDLHRDRQDGKECRSVIRCQCGGDGDRQGYHVAPSGVEGFRAPPCTRGGAALVAGILEGGVQRWQSTVHHFYENEA
jgi:hypothetical protein